MSQWSRGRFFARAYGCVALGALLVQCATASSIEPSQDARADAGADLSSERGSDVVGPTDLSMDATETPSSEVSAPIPDTGTGADLASLEVADAPADSAPVIDLPADTSVDTRPSCGAMQVFCGAECVTVATDVRHCGGCGRGCAAGERCESGVCRLSCPTGQSLCMGSDGVSQCVTFATDRLNCGACGVACASGQECAIGRCATRCPTGQVGCVGPGGVVCTDLTRDAMNCGMCNLACLGTEICEAGACRLNCPAGQVACNGACAALATDARNCGACANVCATGSGATAACAMGRCWITCDSGLGDCDGVASNGCEADLTSSATNCGVCANTCRTGLVCGSGRCVPLCAAPTTLCGSTCVNLASNTRNCGACGALCPAPAGALASCVLGRCGIVCLTGRGNCDGLASNGCEADLMGAVSNCGVCGRVCLTGSSCVSGSCTTPRRVIEDFDTGIWPRAPWVSVAGGGVVATTCAHDGARGIQDPGWYYRTDVTVGAVGQRLSAWVRAGSGRYYLGFGADSSGGFSLVAGTNTSQLQFQRNAGYNYSVLSSAAQSLTLGQWYRLEVTFTSATTVTGRVYGADGSTVVQTLGATLSGFVPRGVAMRSFGGFCSDTLELR